MIIVGFDETHHETWTIDKAEAVKNSRSVPTRHFYGHLADILGADPEYKVIRITLPWSVETLAGVDVLVVAHPASRGGNSGNAQAAAPAFSAEDKSIIEKFLAAGGGLLVATENDPGRTDESICRLCEEYNILFNSDVVPAGRGGSQDSVLVHSFDCMNVTEHRITRGVSAVRVHRACSLTVDGPAVALVRAPGSEVIAACCERSQGRVVAIGDSDLFSIPHIGAMDNIRFFCNAIDWLAETPALRKSGNGRSHLVTASRAFIKDRAYSFRAAEYNKDLACEAGPHVVHINDSERAALTAGIEHLSPYAELEAFLGESELKYQELPRRIRTAINAFKRHGNEYGAFLVRRLPIDAALPITPADARRATEKSTYISEMVLSAFSMGLGELFSYKQEKEGDLFHNVCPTAHNVTNLSSESSEIALDFHTETAFHPHLPDFVLLLCLRADHSQAARTEVASVRHIVEQLPVGCLATLFESVFVTGIDYSFGSKSGLQGNGPAVPVLYGDKYDPFLKYDLDLMVGSTQEANEALLHMKRAANACKNFVKLVPGDLMMLDNKRCVHARSRFTPRWDGQDRWLQRTYVIRDLTSPAQMTMMHSRVVDVEFRV